MPIMIEVSTYLLFSNRNKRPINVCYNNINMWERELKYFHTAVVVTHDILHYSMKSV